MNIQLLREAVKTDRAVWLRHSLERMMERGISRSDVKNVLAHGELIDSYPDDRPFEGGLFLGGAEKKAIHVVASIDEK